MTALKRLSHLLFVGFSLAFSTASFASSHASISSTTIIAPMLKKAMPAVVNLVVTGKLEIFNDPFLKKELQRAHPGSLKKLEKMEFAKTGSGVIINAKQGIIITNAHVIDQAQTIIINLSDGRKYLARVIGKDDATDIAILKIKASDLTALPFGNSSNLKVGDFVAAIGSPFGLQQTVTSGIVSGLHRSNLKIEGFENFIQTDAPINAGNSGGALVNSKGQLVGINTAILSDSGGNIGIGFAIPSNMVKSVVDQILTYGKVHRGILGIVVQSLNPQLATALTSPKKVGAVVTQVVPDSAAAKAGLQVGDIILNINHQTITSNSDVKNIVGLLRIGDAINIEVSRHGNFMQLHGKVGDPKTLEIAQRTTHPFLYGLQLENTVEQTSDYNRLKGVKILTVKSNTLPWTMGLAKGDIIVSANDQPTPNIQTLDDIASRSVQHLLLRVYQKNRAVFVLL